MKSWKMSRLSEGIIDQNSGSRLHITYRQKNTTVYFGHCIKIWPKNHWSKMNFRLAKFHYVECSVKTANTFGSVNKVI